MDVPWNTTLARYFSFGMLCLTHLCMEASLIQASWQPAARLRGVSKLIWYLEANILLDKSVHGGLINSSFIAASCKVACYCNKFILASRSLYGIWRLTFSLYLRCKLTITWSCMI